MLQLVVKLPAVRAGRGRIQQRPVVAEDLCIVEIEIVIARAVLTEGIVKRGVQMIALPAELDDVPGVQVALAIGAVPVADGDHARQPKPVTQQLDRFGHALAHADAVGQRANDFVRIRLFELIIADVFHDEIMDRALLLRRRKTAQRPQQARHARLDRLPVLPDTLFLKPVLRPELHKRRLRHRAARKTNGVEDLRMIQLELEKERAERFHRQARDARRRRQLPQAGQHAVIGRALLRRELLVIILCVQLHGLLRSFRQIGARADLKPFFVRP